MADECMGVIESNINKTTQSACRMCQHGNLLTVWLTATRKDEKLHCSYKLKMTIEAAPLPVRPPGPRCEDATGAIVTADTSRASGPCWIHD